MTNIISSRIGALSEVRRLPAVVRPVWIMNVTWNALIFALPALV